MQSSKNKIITVIVAAYKAKLYIAEALTSVLEQELPEGWELCLMLGVDSCKETLAESLRLSDNRLNIYMMEKNRGTYITFNTMMSKQSGDIIVRFDADDVMLPGFLKETIRQMKEGHNFLRFKFQCMDWKGRRYNSFGLSHGQIAFTNKVWEKLGGFQPWKCAADTEFCYRAESLFKHKYLEDRTYMLYRRTESQLTAAKATSMASPYRKSRHAYIENMKLAKTYFRVTPLTGRSRKVA